MIPLSEAEVLKFHLWCLFLGDDNSHSQRLTKGFGQVIRQGSDITLVGWGAQLTIMEQACLDAENVSLLCFALNKS